MITTLRLKFGRTPGAQADTIDVSPVTGFVGPNDSGKSRVLAEIEQYCRGGIKNAATALFDDFATATVSRDAA